jgi:hypothetical protein
MFTIFFLGPDVIITNIRNNNVTHDEPVSSQEQPSSLQTKEQLRLDSFYY